MSKLIVWNLVTLDGYFEGDKPWDLEFHNKAWGPELERLSDEFGKKAGTFVFGRKTYEGMAAHWKTAKPGNTTTYMNALPKLVASRSLKETDWNNSRVTADIVSEIQRLKSESDKDSYVFGSAELIDDLLGKGLVDEMMLCVVPVLIGKGNPLFKQGRQADLALIESKALDNGGLIVRYAPRS